MLKCKHLFDDSGKKQKNPSINIIIIDIFKYHCSKVIEKMIAMVTAN